MAIATLSILIFLQDLIYGVIILVLTYNNPTTYSLYPKILIKGLLPILMSIFPLLISIKNTNIILKYISILVTIFLFCYVMFWGLGYIIMFSFA